MMEIGPFSLLYVNRHSQWGTPCGIMLTDIQLSHNWGFRQGPEISLNAMSQSYTHMVYAVNIKKTYLFLHEKCDWKVKFNTCHAEFL